MKLYTDSSNKLEAVLFMRRVLKHQINPMQVYKLDDEFKKKLQALIVDALEKKTDQSNEKTRK